MTVPHVLSFSHVFEYRWLHGRLKPVIPVWFEYCDLGVTIQVVVDSGADYTTLPPQFAEALGVNMHELPHENSHSAGGSFTYYKLENVDMHIAEGQIVVRGPVTFVEALAKRDWGVLGREAVFDSLKIAFNQQQCREPFFYMGKG